MARVVARLSVADSLRGLLSTYGLGMRPNSKMVEACNRALGWHADYKDARGLVESWMLRFARSVTSDKQFPTVRRLHDWFAENEGYRAASGFFTVAEAGPSAERMAWDMLGGDAGVEWAREAVTSAPAEEDQSVAGLRESSAGASSLADDGRCPADGSDATVVELASPPRRAASFAPSMNPADWADPDVFASFEGRRPEWRGVLGLEGVMTSDGRVINPEGLSWRELPITLQYQVLSQGGHEGSAAVGPIVNIWRTGEGDGYRIMGEGLFDTGEYGQDARRQMENGTKQGVSMDLTEVKLNLPEDPEELERVFMGEAPLEIVSARIGAATLVSIPAFEGARLSILGDMPDDSDEMDALVASGGRVADGTFRVVFPIEFAVSPPAHSTEDVSPPPSPVEWAAVSDLPEGAYPADDGLYEIDSEPASLADAVPSDEVTSHEAAIRQFAELGATGQRAAIDQATAVAASPPLVDEGDYAYSTALLDALTASGGSVRPPSSWFDQIDYAAPVPFTVEEPDASGMRRMHGHVGLKGSCHIGFQGRCVQVPMGLDYESFQGGRAAGIVRCADGETVHAGPVVMGTEHAAVKDVRGRTVPAGQAIDHYAHSGCLVGQVRCYEDRHGVQVQGWVLPGVTDEQLARLDASDLSPDWRPRATASGGRGVVGMLVVGVSGFNTALVASAAELADNAPADELSDWDTERAVAARKVEALQRLGVDASGLAELVLSDHPPAHVERRDRVLARLGGCSCGCGSCGS